MLCRGYPGGAQCKSSWLRMSAVLCALSIYFCHGVFAASVSVDADDEPIYSLDQLSGRKVGILVGTILDKAIEKKLDYTHLAYYDDYFEMEVALLSREIDGIIGDYPVLQQIAVYVPGLRVLEDLLEEGHYGFAFRKSDEELRDEVDEILVELRNSGELARLVAKWVTGPEEGRAFAFPAVVEGMPEFRIGTSSAMPPFSYRIPGAGVTGFDIELACIVARKIGRQPVVLDMEFGSLIPSLVDGDIDTIASCLSITSERKKIIYFSDGYFLSGVGVMVRE